MSGNVWYVVLLLTVVNVVNYMDRMALAVLAPSIKRDLALSDSQLGLLVGLAFSLFYAVCGVPIARWADRGVRRNIIALALATWSAMTALSGAAQNFWHLFLARLGVGAGGGGGVCRRHGRSCATTFRSRSARRSSPSTVPVCTPASWSAWCSRAGWDS
ncbi:MAG: MFS transporter [Gammaproteobacteria bacterium]|nr:MFS transporter [Gammaproteobacteria bacterium]